MVPDRRRKAKIWLAVMFAGASIFSLARAATAADAGKGPTIADLVSKAKKETTFRAQWGADTLDGGPGLQKIIAAMNKKYGLNLQASFTPGSNMQGQMAKIIRELAAGQPASSDVYFGNPQSMLQAMENQP
jgi:hypothetical protein